MKTPHWGEAPATRILIALCVGVAILQMLLGPGLSIYFDAWLGLTELGLRSGFWWQPLTYMFLHDTRSPIPIHLIVNMLGLWFAGREVERRFGLWRYLTTYFVGGIVGGLIQVTLTSAPNVPLIGASAGVCAVLLAFTALYPNMVITALLFFVLPLRIKAKYMGYLVLVTSAVLGISGWQPGVGHFAHLGGAVVGLVFAVYFGYGRGFFPTFAFGRNPSLTVLPPEPAQMDVLLNKVLRQGLHSLTPDERESLERWSRRRR